MAANWLEFIFLVVALDKVDNVVSLVCKCDYVHKVEPDMVPRLHKC